MTRRAATTGDLQPHPLCAVFPRADQKDMDKLIESMQAHGFDPAHPITLRNGMILDGFTAITRLGSRA